MIRIEVRLSAALRERLNITDAGPLHLEVAQGLTLSAVYQALGLAPEQVAFCTVNNRYPPEGYTLQDGDRLHIVAHAAGG